MICQAFEIAVDIKMASLEGSLERCYTRPDTLAEPAKKGEEG